MVGIIVIVATIGFAIGFLSGYGGRVEDYERRLVRVSKNAYLDGCERAYMLGISEANGEKIQRWRQRVEIGGTALPGFIIPESRYLSGSFLSEDME
mgnify:CR=1 FL=1